MAGHLGLIDRRNQSVICGWQDRSYVTGGTHVQICDQVATLTVLSVGVIATAPTIPAFAAGGGGGGGGGGPPGEDIMRPSAPPSNTKSPAATRSSHRAKKSDKQSFLNDPAFIRGYRTAYETIYGRNNYASAIDQLKALGHDD